MENYDIDFVILWVDGNDENWINEKKKYEKEKGKNDDARVVRYRDWNNLQYWFRGVEKFTPWVRKIHFVTWGHIPQWLDTSNPKINIVKHTDFIPKEYLPTFSCYPIELNIHRIEGLAEHFVYFNDDMFVIKNMKKEDFFYKGLPLDCAIQNAISFIDSGEVKYILANHMFIINRYFNKRKVMKKNISKWFSPKYSVEIFRNICLLPWRNFTGIMFTHMPSAFLKSTFVDVWEKEYEVLNETCHHRFRKDIDVSQWLFCNWQIVSGKFYPRRIRDGRNFLIYSDGNKNIDAYKTIRKQKCKQICLNDFVYDSNINEIINEVNSCFDVILPNKSEFEKLL